MKKQLVILGSTGSIGTQAIDIVRAFPDQFSLVGISGFSNIEFIIQQANEFHPSFITVSTEAQKEQLLGGISYQPTVFVGEQGLIELVQVDMDILLVSIVGTAALPPVVAAIPRVEHIAIANKEVLVAAGGYYYGYGSAAPNNINSGGLRAFSIVSVFIGHSIQL